MRNFHVPDDRSTALAVGLLKQILTVLLAEPHALHVNPASTADGGVTMTLQSVVAPWTVTVWSEVAPAATLAASKVTLVGEPAISRLCVP